MPKTLILLSGGMDSAAALGLAVEANGPRNVEGIAFRYGQRHTRELDAATNLSVAYDIKLNVVGIPQGVFQGSGSALIPEDQVAMPQATYEELQASEGPSPTYVPFRNGTFISVATARALAMGASELWMGVHAEDAHNFAYPDCTPEFVGAMANAIYIGTYFKVRLVTPFQWMTKGQIAATGAALKVPFELTWSCYEGKTLACGKCPTCVGRLEAFATAGLVDPLEYAIPDNERPDMRGKNILVQ